LHIAFVILLLGLYEPRQTEKQLSASEFDEQRLLSNRKVLKTVKHDKFADQLLEMTEADAKLKRMSMPRIVSERDVKQFTLSPRFCVQQGPICVFALFAHCSLPCLWCAGFKANGDPKLRAIDDFSRSGA